MRRIRIERKAWAGDTRDRYAVLELDPRDQEVLRAKQLSRDRDRTAEHEIAGTHP